MLEFRECLAGPVSQVTPGGKEPGPTGRSRLSPLAMEMSGCMG